jgi:hypothetical protein
LRSAVLLGTEGIAVDWFVAEEGVRDDHIILEA